MNLEGGITSMRVMRAWRLHAYNDHRLEEVPVPEVKPGWALVKVKVVQMAVVDAGLIQGMPHLHQSHIKKIFSEGKPVQLGHEFCGEVVEIGEGVATLKPGDRVGTTSYSPCGTCRMCREGKRCLTPLVIGSQIPGAYSEYMVVPEIGLIKIPDGPTDNAAAAFQPLSAAVAHVRSAEINMGDSVVVMGQGAMGLGVLQMAKFSGAGLLIAVDIRPETLALAHEYGADIVLNAAEVDIVEGIKKITDGLGADIVFEEAGGRVKDGLAGTKTLEQAFQIVKKGGKVLQGANIDGSMEIDQVFMRNRRISYIFTKSVQKEDYQLGAFWVASGRVKIQPQISHVFHGLEKLPEAMEITVFKKKHRATNPAQIIV